MKHISVIVTGNVQGVFFRASAKKIADELNIKGFAQNLPDGSVYIEAEGAVEHVDKFIVWCKHDPPRAQVTDVIIHQDELKNFDQFEVRH